MKGVRYELKVWGVMGQQGYVQNAGILVALVCAGI